MESITQAAQMLSLEKDRLDNVLIESGIVHEPERMQAGQLGADASVAALLFEEAYEQRALEWAEQEQEPGTLVAQFTFGAPVSLVPAQRLVFLLKAFYVFLRAYQDAMYAVLLELTNNQRTRYPRMQAVLKKEGNPVGVMIRERLPEYVEWFAKWREQRNRIKDGINFGTIGPATDLGISFNTFDEGGGLVIDFEGGDVIRHADVRNALEMSARLTRLAFELAAEKLQPAASDPSPEPGQ